MAEHTVQDEINDTKIMIEADRGHLDLAVARGDRVLAHGHVDSIIDNQRHIEDLEAILVSRVHGTELGKQI